MFLTTTHPYSFRTTQILSVPDTNTLRLNQTGQILGLELPTPEASITTTDLPQLLTGSPIETGLTLQDTQVVVDSTGHTVAIESGNTFIGNDLDVSGSSGGNVDIFGQAIALKGATVNASGENGGGNIRVGGDLQGQGELPAALTISIDVNSSLNADSTQTGAGGSIIAWSDERTDFDGSLTATGIEKGGFAEISSKGILDLAPGWSQRIKLSAANGDSGKLLLDPANINIVSSGSGASLTGNPFEPSTDSNILDDDIQTFLGSDDLEIRTPNDGGNIIIEDGVNIFWNSGNALEFDAAGDITVEDNVMLLGTTASSITFEAGNDISIGNSINFEAGDIELDAGGRITSNANLNATGSWTLKAAGDINVQDITAFNDDFSTPPNSIEVTSSTGDIKAGAIATAAKSGGSTAADAGDVDLSAAGDIEVDYIDASSIGGDGGGINVSADGFVKVISSTTPTSDRFGTPVAGETPFSVSNATYEPTGSVMTFELRIEHGGQGSTPFIVGDATTNGTARHIVTGAQGSSGSANAIAPTASFSDTYNQGDIAIVTDTSSGNSSGNGNGNSGDTDVDTGSGYIGDGDPTDTSFSSGTVMESPVLTLDIPVDCVPTCAEGTDPTPVASTTNEEEIEGEDPRETLKIISEVANVTPALLYIYTDDNSAIASAESETDIGLKDQTKANAKVSDIEGDNQWQFSSDRLTDYLNNATYNYLNPRDLNQEGQLTIVLVTPDGEVFRERVNNVNRREIIRQSQQFMRGVSNPRSRPAQYLAPAQYLYDAFIRPVESVLAEKEIDNISFIMDDGLRTLPVAALHDGQQFLVEKYSLGMMPSFSLTNTSPYIQPKENRVLAMGASEFDIQIDLPAASVEVQLITQEIWQGEASNIIDQEFTVENLLKARERSPYSIIHLATHGEFTSGGAETSYIQFQDQKVTLDNLDKLQLTNHPLELLVLSACRTAIGDRQAELGFSGLALNSGAKSAIGSIWYVSDTGTMGLMSKFYDALQQSSTKAGALQETQIAMINGEITVQKDTLTMGERVIPLTKSLGSNSRLNLTHPYHWSGFTLVGNPW